MAEAEGRDGRGGSGGSGRPVRGALGAGGLDRGGWCAWTACGTERSARRDGGSARRRQDAALRFAALGVRGGNYTPRRISR
jgi:hypothetical protein